MEAGEVVTFQFNVKVDDNVDGEIIDNHADVDDGMNQYVTNATKNPTPKKVTPKTEDKNNSSIYGTILAGSLLALVCVAVIRKFVSHQE